MSVRLPATTPSVNPRQSSLGRDVAGIASFWCVVLTATLATLLLYCWPALARIERQSQALTASQNSVETLRQEKARLDAENAALDDPFYLERILRVDFYWRASPVNPPDASASARANRP